MAQLVDGSQSLAKIANFWKERGKPVSQMTISKWRRRPEVAGTIKGVVGEAIRKKSISHEIQKHAEKMVAPKINRLTEMAEETYELAKMDPKRQYKAMTDAMNVLLGVTRLEAEVNGELGQTAQKGGDESQVQLTLSNMIILPRSASYQAVGDVIDVEDVGDGPDYVDSKQDLRLIEDA